MITIPKSEQHLLQIPMTFTEAWDHVTNQGDGDALLGMYVIKHDAMNFDPSNYVYSPSMIRSFQAHNIVFEGMGKLLGAE